MKHYSRIIAAVAMLAGGVLPLSASTVTYDFGQLSGGTSPDGTPPWLQAVFTDNSQPANTVQLTLTAGNLTGNEFVSCWYFNLNPALDPTGLNISVSGSSGSVTGPTVQTGANAFKAGPDGKYDVLLGFSTANSGRFMAGDSITFTITDLSGLTADDFDQLSTAAGGAGPYLSAAHVQSIGQDGDSAWINPTSTFLNSNDRSPLSVPDGSTTAILLGASLLAMVGLRNKLRVVVQ